MSAESTWEHTERPCPLSKFPTRHLISAGKDLELSDKVLEDKAPETSELRSAVEVKTLCLCSDIPGKMG